MNGVFGNNYALKDNDASKNDTGLDGPDEHVNRVDISPRIDSTNIEN